MTLGQFIRFSATLTFVGLAGCAINYRSPGVASMADPLEIAIVEPEKFQVGAAFFISKIDGQGKGLGMISKIELTPGRHSITGSVNPATLRGADVTRYFDAKAGRKYLVSFHSDAKERLWGFSIVEADTLVRVDESN